MRFASREKAVLSQWGVAVMPSDRRRAPISRRPPAPRGSWGSKNTPANTGIEVLGGVEVGDPRREYGLAAVSGVLCRRRPERLERLFIEARFATPPPRGSKLSTSPHVSQGYWFALAATIVPGLIRGVIAGPGEQGGQGSSIRHESKDPSPTAMVSR